MMFKSRFCFIFTVYLIVQCTGLAGCAQKPNVFSQAETNDNSLKYNTDDTGYDQYLKKIWVANDWDGSTYMYPSSFRLTKIENGALEGQLSTHAVADPPCYMKATPVSVLGKYEPNLFGTINNGVAECQFSSKYGDKGTITLTFKENNRIEAAIEYETVAHILEPVDIEQYNEMRRETYSTTPENREYFKKLPPMNGTYLFRPHNFTDYYRRPFPGERFNPLKTHSFETDLDYWGKVNFVTVVFGGNKPHPTAYLTNEFNDILYNFNVPFQVGTEITKVLIEDMNGDDLKDIKFFYDYPPLPGEEPDYEEYMTWICFQMDDGIFYDSEFDKDTESNTHNH